MGKILEFVSNNKESIIHDKPADILEFCKTCKGCNNLIEVDDGTFICSSRLKINDEPIVPIIQNEYTSDWGYCGGEFYERNFRKASGGNRR